MGRADLRRFLALHAPLPLHVLVRTTAQFQPRTVLPEPAAPGAGDSTRRPGYRRRGRVSPHGDIIQDFCFISRPNALHVLNAPSPAATASLAIGDHIVGQTIEVCRLSPC
ncbi:hypothetical protein SBA3_1980021 [Candidatus Sulfopaludibacter sp. SbA3]|nr:hypothetical protein SBA3_1980021 [Candidatus Sulfopaludibacter sp. SbA3]